LAAWFRARHTGAGT
jgi:site-specific recombinase XerD